MEFLDILKNETSGCICSYEPKWISDESMPYLKNLLARANALQTMPGYGALWHSGPSDPFTRTTRMCAEIVESLIIE
jgi:hypothetical protein